MKLRHFLSLSLNFVSAIAYANPAERCELFIDQIGFICASSHASYPGSTTRLGFDDGCVDSPLNAGNLSTRYVVLSLKVNEGLALANGGVAQVGFSRVSENPSAARQILSNETALFDGFRDLKNIQAPTNSFVFASLVFGYNGQRDSFHRWKREQGRFFIEFNNGSTYWLQPSGFDFFDFDETTLKVLASRGAMNMNTHNFSGALSTESESLEYYNPYKCR